MPVSNIEPYFSVASHGGNTYPFAFKIFDQGELVVKVDGTVKTLGLDYTVTITAEPGEGGSIIFQPGYIPVAGALTVEGERAVIVDRSTDYQEAGGFRQSVVDKDFDRLVMMAQDGKRNSGVLQGLIDSAFDMIAQLAAAGSALLENFSLTFKPLDIIAKGPWIDARAYPTFAEAIAAASAASKALMFSVDQDLIANIVIPANVELLPLNGAKINHGAYTISYAGSTARWPLAQIFSGTGAVSGFKMSRPEWFGVTGIDDYVPIQKAASSLTEGGVLEMHGAYIMTPPGTTPQTARVYLLDNTWVRGTGKATTMLQGGGISSWFFDASGKTGIKISDLSITHGNLLFMVLGSGVVIDNVAANGYVSEDITHTLASECVRLHGVDRINVSRSEFIDYNDGIWLGDNSAITYTTNAVIESCHFEQTQHGTYWENPVGIYLVYTKKVKIENCTFKNIYPGKFESWSMGYGFYAGDGIVDDTVISNCTFDFDEAVSLQYAQHVLFWSTSGRWKLAGNTFNGKPQVVGAGTDVAVVGNSFSGSTLSIFKADKAVVTGNTFDSSLIYDSINFGLNTDMVVNAIASHNNINKCAKSAITFNVVRKGIATGNIITDPNTSGTSGSDGIAFISCLIGAATGNIIQNYSTGLAEYGIKLNTVGQGHFQYFDNIIENTTTGGVRGAFTASPTAGVWGYGDRVWYPAPGAGTSPGSVCVFKLDTTLAAGYAGGTTAITVVSGTNTANGDIIGVKLDTGSIHWTTIVSGGGTTSPVLTVALPSAAASGNKVYVRRWKGMANLAA